MAKRKTVTDNGGNQLNTISTNPSNTTSKKEPVMNNNFKLYTDSNTEVTIDWAWDDTKSYTENLDLIAAEVEAKKVNMFRTTIYGEAEPTWVDRHGYESQAALGAVINTILHKTYSGSLGDGDEEIATQKGCHVFNAQDRFESNVAVVKAKSKVWDMIPVKPTVNMFDCQWLSLVDRNGTKFLRKLSGNSQKDINTQCRSHDYVDLLLEHDLMIWVAPIRRLLAAHLMSWFTPDKAAEFKRNGYDNAIAQDKAYDMETKHKLVNAALKTEEEVLSEPKVLTVVMSVWRSKGTIDIATMIGKSFNVFMKPTSLSPFVRNLEATKDNLWKFAELAAAGYLVKEVAEE